MISLLRHPKILACHSGAALDGRFSIPTSRRHPGGFYDPPQIECLPLQRGWYQAENCHYD